LADFAGFCSRRKTDPDQAGPGDITDYMKRLSGAGMAASISRNRLT
jgi:hypothetical protein